MKLQSLLGTFLFISTLFFSSCRKEFSVENVFPVKNPAGVNIPSIDEAMVKSNVMLQVLDADKKPIAFAAVSCGQQNVMTDKSGIAMFEDVDISTHNGAVSVNKDGYFSCTRTFISEAGRWKYLKVILNEKKLTASIQSEKGGLITLTSGASLTLPPNGIVLKGTDKSYNGTVQVYADWLDPSSPNLMNEMQGELRGINISGEEKAMKTYGMLNVELKGENGEELQLASTQLSTVTFPVSQDLLTTAETSIPLWHFSDSTHRWVEEGSATKNGNVYVGKVNHFSCWNLDYPKPYKLVRCKFKIVNPKHRGCLNREILVHEKGDSWGGHGLSDEDGYLDCLVPEGTELELDILGCNNKKFKVGPYTKENNIDSIVLQVDEGFNIKGNVANCSGNPLEHGYVELNINGAVRVPTVNGFFEVNYEPQICSSIDSIYMYSVDLDTKNISAIHSIPAHLGMDTAISIQACDDLASLASGLAANLEAFYPFSGNSNDESGWGNNGLVVGAALVADRNGNKNEAYSFDGVSNFIDVNNKFFENGWDSSSVSFWMSPSAIGSTLNAGHTILNTYPHNGTGISFDYNGGSTVSFWKNSSPEARNWDVLFFNLFNTVWTTTNNWSHITITKSGFNYLYYVNGVIDKRETAVVSPSLYKCSLRFGASSLDSLGAEFFNGKLDEIRIYSRTLSDREILYLATH